MSGRRAPDRRPTERQRVVLEKRLPRPRGEQRDRLHLVARVVVLPPLPVPVVAHLVVVPHHDLRHLRDEPAHVLVARLYWWQPRIVVERLARPSISLGVTTFFQIDPSSSFTSGCSGLIGVDGVADD